MDDERFISGNAANYAANLVAIRGYLHERAEFYYGIDALVKGDRYAEACELADNMIEKFMVERGVMKKC